MLLWQKLPYIHVYYVRMDPSYFSFFDWNVALDTNHLLQLFLTWNIFYIHALFFLISCYPFSQFKVIQHIKPNTLRQYFSIFLYLIRCWHSTLFTHHNRRGTKWKRLSRPVLWCLKYMGKYNITVYSLHRMVQDKSYKICNVSEKKDLESLLVKMLCIKLNSLCW